MADILETILGLGVVGVLGYIGIQKLFPSSTTQSVPGGSWICNMFSVGCPSSGAAATTAPSSLTAFANFLAANPTTGQQQQFGATFQQQVNTAVANGSAVYDPLLGVSLAIVPSSLGWTS